jgi:hypothetical protein
MTVWLVCNSIAILLLAAVLFLTLRQVGFMLTQLGPVGARTSDDQAPRLGENIGYQIAALDSALRKPIRPILYLLLTHSCAACKTVRAAAGELARHWSNSVDIVVIYDSPRGSGDPISRTLIREGLVEYTASFREQLGVRLVPFGIRTDQNGTVIGRGLVNDVSHVESLLELQSTQDPQAGIIRKDDSPTIQVASA